MTAVERHLCESAVISELWWRLHWFPPTCGGGRLLIDPRPKRGVRGEHAAGGETAAWFLADGAERICAMLGAGKVTTVAPHANEVAAPEVNVAHAAVCHSGDWVHEFTLAGYAADEREGSR